MAKRKRREGPGRPEKGAYSKAQVETYRKALALRLKQVDHVLQSMETVSAATVSSNYQIDGALDAIGDFCTDAFKELRAKWPAGKPRPWEIE